MFLFGLTILGVFCLLAFGPLVACIILAMMDPKVGRRGR